MFEKIQISLPEDIAEINTIVLKNGSFIAGGCVRSILNNEPISDVDVFSNSEESYLNTIEQLKLIGYKELFSNPMLVRLKSTRIIDMVKPRTGDYLRTVGTPEEVISFFDFTVARAAIISDSEALVDENFAAHSRSKKLQIEHIVCPVTQVRRISKYLAKGYKITFKETIKIFLEFQTRNNDLDLLNGGLSAEEMDRLQQWVYID